MLTYPYVWQYVPLVLQILFALAMAGGMVGASFLIGKHKRSRTKLGAYECGMDPVGDARGRFSVRFYMVAMLFILFDVEALFILPGRSSIGVCRVLPEPPVTRTASSASGRSWCTWASLPWGCSMCGRRAS